MDKVYGRTGAIKKDMVSGFCPGCMREKLVPEYQELLDTAREAVRAAGGEPYSNPVRGGTDGSALSFRGLPCPNLGTGGGNYHSRLEYCCVEDMRGSRLA